MTAKQSHMIKTARDEIALSARTTVKHIDNRQIKMRIGTSWAKTESVAHLAELVWKSINGAEGDMNSAYGPVVGLSVPQKFRLKVKLTEELFSVLLGNKRKTDRSGVGITPKNLNDTKLGLIMVLSLSIYVSLRERKMHQEDTVEEFATKRIRCFTSERTDALFEIDIVLCGYMFPNVNAVKLFLRDVIRNFRLVPTTMHQEAWFRHRITDLFCMDVYEQYATSGIPFVGGYIPKKAFYVINEEYEPYKCSGPRKEEMVKAKDCEEPIRDSLWSVEKETQREATFVVMRPLKNIKYLKEIADFNVEAQDLENLLMREYNQKNPFTVEKTATEGVWKLVNHEKAWDCHVCGKEHTKRSRLTVRDDGRVFFICERMKKGKKLKYIGQLRGEQAPALAIIEAKISLSVARHLGVEMGELPFDLLTNNGGSTYFLNIWRDMNCPICGNSHTHRDPLLVSRSESGALFLRCRAGKALKKPFLLLGHLKDRRERRETAMVDEVRIKRHITLGDPFPVEMGEEKIKMYSSIFRDESSCFKIEEYTRSFVQNLGTMKGTKSKGGNLIIQSDCGTGKTYSVFRMLMAGRLEEKRKYDALLGGFTGLTGLTSTGSMRRARELHEGLSMKEIAHMRLSIAKALCSDDQVPEEKLIEDADLDHLDFSEEIEEQHEDDYYQNYWGMSPIKESLGQIDPSTVYQDPEEDLFASNKLLFDLIEGDGYIEPGKLEETSRALDKIHPDIEPTFLWVSTRRTYAESVHSQYKGMISDFILYLDEDGLLDQERLIISIESLTKSTHGINFDYIILDESLSVLEQFYSPHLRESERTRRKFSELITNAKNVVCMDADITSEVLYRFTKLREGPIRFIVNNYQRKVGHTALYHEKVDSLVLELGKDLKRGKRAHVVCTSKKKAHELALLFGNYNPLLITSETNTKETKELVSDIDKVIHDYDLLIFTSTLSVGVDISVLWSDVCYVIADPRTVNSRICLQMADRVREVSKKVLHWTVRPYRRDEPVELPDILATLRESFISSNEMRFQILGDMRVPMDLRHVDEVFDLSDPWVISYLYRVQSENLKLTCLKEMLEWHMKRQGYTMKTFKMEEANEMDVKETKKSQKEAAAAAERKMILKMSNAEWMTADKPRYSVLLRNYKNGVIRQSDLWLLRKSRIMSQTTLECREKLQTDGGRLLELEKAQKNIKKMRRMESGVEKLIVAERKRFDENPSVEMFLGDNNLKLAVVLYITQLLGLTGPTEEKEVLRESKRLCKEEKKGMTGTEIRIAEGSLKACVDWITLHQRFISGVFGLVWKKSFDELAPNTRNRGLRSLFSFGVGNRLDFKTKRRTESGRVNIIQNKCKLNELQSYFA